MKCPTCKQLLKRIEALERQPKAHPHKPAPRMNRWIERAILAVLLPALTAGVERLFNLPPDKSQSIQHAEAAK